MYFWYQIYYHRLSDYEYEQMKTYKTLFVLQLALEGPVFTTPMRFDEDGAQVSSPAGHHSTPLSGGETQKAFKT